MIKKKKDQVQEHFSKERYVQDYEKWFPEKEYQINHQRRVQESRKEISLELKKINRFLENFEKDCPSCKYKGTYSIHIEPNLDEFEIEIEKDVEEVICVRPDVEQREVFDDETEKIPVPKEEVPIHSKEIHEVQFNDVKLKNLKNLLRSSKAMVKKTAKKVLDLTVHKRRVRNFLNGIKNASITDILLESSLTATQSKKRLQERAQSNMNAARSRKKITKFVRIRSKLTTILLSDNSITLVKNVGIIHVLCLFFLPSFLFATIPKSEINSFFGLFLLLTYSTVSLYVISFSISRLILRKNRFRTLTFRLWQLLINSLKIFRHELKKNAFNLDENPKSKDNSKQKQTIRGREAFFDFLLAKVYGVKIGSNLKEVQKKGNKKVKKKVNLEEINRSEKIEIAIKRKQELARKEIDFNDFHDFLLKKVFDKRYLKNNKLNHPISPSRSKGKRTKVKVVRRKRYVGPFRSHFRSINESLGNNSTNNTFTVPCKEDLKKIQELNS